MKYKRSRESLKDNIAILILIGLIALLTYIIIKDRNLYNSTIDIGYLMKGAL